jgi:hypothetical protein
MICWIVSSVIGALCLLFLIVIKNLYIQNGKYEEYIEKMSLEFFNVLDDVREDVSDTLQQMRELDQREMFEKDDEVGVVFSDISLVVEKLDEKLKVYGEETEEED